MTSFPLGLTWLIFIDNIWALVQWSDLQQCLWVHFCESWQFLASSAILVGMALLEPWGLQLYLRKQKACVPWWKLTENIRERNDYNWNGRWESSNPTFSFYWWENWWARKWSDLQKPVRNTLQRCEQASDFLLSACWLCHPGFSFLGLHSILRDIYGEEAFFVHRSFLRFSFLREEKYEKIQVCLGFLSSVF